MRLLKKIFNSLIHATGTAFRRAPITRFSRVAPCKNLAEATFLRLRPAADRLADARLGARAPYRRVAAAPIIGYER